MSELSTAYITFPAWHGWVAIFWIGFEQKMAMSCALVTFGTAKAQVKFASIFTMPRQTIEEKGKYCIHFFLMGKNNEHEKNLRLL
jgi:hypothetical protein